MFASEHEWAADPAVRSVLAGLELDRLGLDAPVAPMSGGERRRVALAAQLIRPLDLLVLDEPTNHLDVEGVAWLAEYVNQRAGGLVVVTHDRWFLDEVCTTTWEVADGAVHAYDGGYSAYTLARAERARISSVTEERRQNLVRKELAWLRRGPPARTSKPKFRIEAAQALIADEPPARDTMALKGFAARRLGKTVYDVEDVVLRRPHRRRPAHAVPRPDLERRPGRPDRHRRRQRRGQDLAAQAAGGGDEARRRVGRRRPDRRAGLPVAARHRAAAARPGCWRRCRTSPGIARIGNQEISASTLAERFGFAANRQWTPVGDLSGGERRRLQLLRLLMAEPNVLVLDEPTNDLDIDTLTALEDLLDSFPGTVLVVSHDRYFVDRVCDKVVALLGDGTLAELPGGVDEYLRRRAAGGAPADDGGRRRGTASGRGALDRGARRSRPPRRGRRRRRSAGWSGGCSSWTPTRRSCTSSSPRPRPTTRRPPSSTRSSRRCRRRRTRSRRPGWPPRSSPTADRRAGPPTVQARSAHVGSGHRGEQSPTVGARSPGDPVTPGGR